MGKITDLTGQTFGRLTVKKYAGADKRNRALWECNCECGSLSVLPSRSLLSGNTKSCGCYAHLVFRKASVTHGETINGKCSFEYVKWKNMVRRCTNPKADKWRYYGGRGIKVCDRWMKFDNFLSDMGRCPKGLTLDRIDPDGNYEPENCRWATWVQQRHNRSNRKPEQVKTEINA